MSSFAYIGGLIPTILIEVLIVICIILYLYYLKTKNKLCNGESNKKSYTPFHLMNSSDRPFYISLFIGGSIESTYKSCLDKGRNQLCTLILLLFRLGFLGFFLGITCIDDYLLEKGRNWFYFTTWNVDLISLYYLLAVLFSIIGIYSDNYKQSKIILIKDDHGNWTENFQIIGFFFQILFQVAAATAFFVTTINFILLSPEFYFWNVAQHFVTSISFLVELLLNSIIVRWEILVFHLQWVVLYLIYIWPMVVTGYNYYKYLDYHYNYYEY